MVRVHQRRISAAHVGALALVLAMVATVLWTGSAANADAMREAVSGSFTDTAIDTSGGGNAANLISGATAGATYEGIWEIELTGPSEACDGNIEGSVVAYSIVRRYNNGDLLYSALDTDDPGSTCFDPAGVAELTINAVITGGTGRFAGASGSYTAEYNVQLLVADPAGGIAHGSFAGEVVGTS